MSDRFSSPQAGPAPESGGKPTLPSQLAIATELWLVVVLGQAVAYAGQYPSASESVREAARNASSGATADEVRLLTSTSTIVGVYVGVGVVLSLLSLLIVWLARTGHNWARMVLIFFSAFIVVQTLVGLFGDSATSWTTIPAVLSGVAALGAAYLLMQRDVETYCRAMTTFRRGGTPAGGQQGWPPVPSHQHQHQQPPQPPQTPGYDPSARYDPYAQRPPQSGSYQPGPHHQGPYGSGPQQPGGYGAPPPLYRSAPEDRRSSDQWEPARGENVRERQPERPAEEPGPGPEHRAPDDRGE